MERYDNIKYQQLPLMVSRTILQCKLLSAEDRVVVAVSAGPDSMALLHLLHSIELPLALTAVYVDHSLRPAETVLERRVVAEFAAELGLPFVWKQVDVPGSAETLQGSVEERARILRYQALDEVLQEQDGDKIAVAHTADDQVEEFFLRLARGTGLKGLSGMARIHDRVVRPLLDIPKAALMHYLQAHGIAYCHDSSNDSRKYLRNRVRLDLLPLLKNAFNPEIAATVRQTMNILQQDEDYLAALSEECFQQCCVVSNEKETDIASRTVRLDCKLFLTLHPSMQGRVLERIFWKLNNKPSFARIKGLRQLATDGRNGAQMHLPLGLRVQMVRDTVVFSYPEGYGSGRREGVTPSFFYYLTVPGITMIEELGKTLLVAEQRCSQLDSFDEAVVYLDVAKLSFPLTLRPVVAGEKMQPLGASGRKKINRILSDMKIPVTEKPYYPVLADSEGPVALVGARIADRVKVDEESQRVLAISFI